jgi:hypothetical protein
VCLCLSLRAYVEHKRVDVEVERLVVEEELGQQAQALAVHLATA